MSGIIIRDGDGHSNLRSRILNRCAGSLIFCNKINVGSRLVDIAAIYNAFFIRKCRGIRYRPVDFGRTRTGFCFSCRYDVPVLIRNLECEFFGSDFFILCCSESLRADKGYIALCIIIIIECQRLNISCVRISNIRIDSIRCQCAVQVIFKCHIHLVNCRIISNSRLCSGDFLDKIRINRTICLSIVNLCAVFCASSISFRIERQCIKIHAAVSLIGYSAAHLLCAGFIGINAKLISSSSKF